MGGRRLLRELTTPAAVARDLPDPAESADQTTLSALAPSSVG